MLIPAPQTFPKQGQQMVSCRLGHGEADDNASFPHLAAEVGQLLPADNAHVVVSNLDGQAGAEDALNNDGFGEGRLLRLVQGVVLP